MADEQVMNGEAIGSLTAGPMPLSTGRVARRLGVRPEWVRRWATAGELEGVRRGPGMRWFFRAEAVDRFVTERRKWFRRTWAARA